MSLEVIKRKLNYYYTSNKIRKKLYHTTHLHPSKPPPERRAKEDLASPFYVA
jgi:hypothetical protein